MSTVKKILRNKNAKAGGLYLLGNLFDKAIIFLTIPIFTRLMPSSDFGIVNTYLSWVTILTVVVGLSLGNTIRSAYLDFKDDFEQYISSIFFLSLLNFVFISSIIIFISFLFIEQIDIVLVVFCLLQAFMIFVINSISIKYMMSMDYIKKTLLLALPNIIITGLSVIFLMNVEDEKYLGRIIPYVIVTSIFGSYFLVKYFVKGKKFFNKKYWKYAIGLSLPLIFHSLSITILNVSDRTMITAFRSASETGIYSLAYSFSMIALVVTTSLGSVWIPWFNRKMQNDERDIINENVKLYIEIIVVVMLAILLVGPELLVMMAPEEYWSGKFLIAPILLASFFIFLCSISVDLEYYYKSTKVIAINTMIAASINLLLNYFLIPKSGAMGAAFATVIAYIISFVIHYYAARKLDNKLFPYKIYIKPILIMIVAINISYILMDYVIIRWLLTIVGFTIYVLVSFRKQKFKDILTL